jgi:replication-associated recombination protein RarA
LWGRDHAPKHSDYGPAGTGKTTLATTLAPLLNAVVFNADAVSANLSRDLSPVQFHFHSFTTSFPTERS